MVESVPINPFSLFKPHIMTLGTLGTGKSTFLNKVHGAAEAAFEANDSEYGVT